MQLLPLSLTFLLSLLLAVAPPALAAFQNVTTLLDNHPDYSLFNGLLSQYGVAPQINSRTTITVLCPRNRAVTDFLSGPGAGLDRQSVFNILSFHVLLDYEDPAKLRSLAGGFATITTLYQTTGLATGGNGFMNITVAAGVVKVHRPGTTTFATIGSSIEKFPFNISLLDVNQVLIPSGIGAGPAPPPVNITQIISQAGNFSQFVAALASTGVDKVIQSHDTPPGITIFAPTNAAFDRLAAAAGSGAAAAINRLTSAQLVALMEFHALVSFYPTEELATASGPQATLASGSGGGAYTVTLSQNKAGIIIINAGGNTVPIAGTLFSNNPVAVFVIDSLLLPAEIFGAAAAPPSPGLSSAPSKSPASTVPAPERIVPSPSGSIPVSSPSPFSVAPVPVTPSPVPMRAASPPAPLLLAPESIFAPAEGPSASSPESPTSSSHLINLPSFSFTMLLFVTFFLGNRM